MQNQNKTTVTRHAPRARDWHRRPWRLAAKLVLVLVFFFLLQVALVAIVGGHKVGHYVEQIVYPNLQQQAVYLVTDLRQRSSDAEYLYNLSRRLRIDFAVRQRDHIFATSAGLETALRFPERLELIYDDHHSKRRSFRPPAPRHAEHFGYFNKVPYKNSFPLRKPGLSGKFSPVEWNDTPALFYRERDFSALLVFSPDLYPVADSALWLLGSGTLLLLILALFCVQRLLRPLQDLRCGISNMEEGRFDQAIVSRSRDEFGMLANAFNRMSERINEQFRQREQLLADISHELRSPLARMRIVLEFLHQKKEKKLLLEEVEEQEHLLALLLDNARLGSLMGNFQPSYSRFDLSLLTRQIAASYKEDRLQTNFPDTPLWIKADKTLLPRVLTNLLDNALKYTSKSVWVELSQVEEQLLLRVLDQGKGIPQEEHERIFTAFYRLDKSRTRSSNARGYGLGLSLCQRIVEAHGGSIGIDPQYTAGTCVWVRLPLAPESESKQ